MSSRTRNGRKAVANAASNSIANKVEELKDIAREIQEEARRNGDAIPSNSEAVRLAKIVNSHANADMHDRVDDQAANILRTELSAGLISNLRTNGNGHANANNKRAIAIAVADHEAVERHAEATAVIRDIRRGGNGANNGVNNNGAHTRAAKVAMNARSAAEELEDQRQEEMRKAEELLRHANSLGHRVREERHLASEAEDIAESASESASESESECESELEDEIHHVIAGSKVGLTVRRRVSKKKKKGVVKRGGSKKAAAKTKRASPSSKKKSASKKKVASSTKKKTRSIKRARK